MERVLTEEEIKNKQVLEQAQMYLDGNSLRVIADMYNVSHVTIRYNLQNKLKDINSLVYKEVVAKLNDNTPDSVNKKEVAQRVLEVYKLLVEDDMTVLEIVDYFNRLGTEVNEFTIYRDITVRLRKLHEISPDTVTQEMIDTALRVLEKHKLDNLSKKNNEKEDSIESDIDLKILYLMYPTKAKRMHFIATVALTFGLNLDSLSKLFKKDAEELKRDLFSSNDGLRESLDWHFYREFRYQDDGIKEFKEFFKKLVDVYLNKDIETVKVLLAQLGDSEAIKFKKSHKPGDKITEENIETIFKYQIKYGLSSQTIADIFNINKSWYVSRVNKYTLDKPKLASVFMAIQDYYNPNYGGRR